MNDVFIVFQDGGLGKIDIPLLADYQKTISRDYDVLLDAGFALRGNFTFYFSPMVSQYWANAFVYSFHFSWLLVTVYQLIVGQNNPNRCQTRFGFCWIRL